MKTKFNPVVIIIFSFIFFAVKDSEAAVFIDCNFNQPPSSENQGGQYQCSMGSLTLFFGSNLSGQVFDHSPTEGWNGSGAAKFYTHISAQSYYSSYRQLDPSPYISNVRQNLRFLIKLEPGMSAEMGGKWHIKEPGPAWRSWVGHGGRAGSLSAVQPEISYDNTEWLAHGDNASAGECSSNGYQCCQHLSTWYDNAISSCTRTETRVFDWSAHENEWVTFELERNNQGTMAIYIWTRDREFSGKYYEVDTIFHNDDLGAPPVGAFLEDTEFTNTGKYFLIDEVKYSDNLIGPPVGFVESIDTTPPATPGNLSVR